MTWVITIFGFGVGTILGSLALALADRCLENKTFFGRSNCPNCKHKLAPPDLVPILSYLSLKGRCRYCQKKIKLEYLLVELLMGILVAILVWQSAAIFNSTGEQLIFSLLQLIFQTFILTVLVIVAITDFKNTIIPDRITYPAIKITLTYMLLIVGLKIYFLYQSLAQNPIGKFLLSQTDYFVRHSLLVAEPLISSLIMALVIGLFFLSLIIFTKGRGMGGGDLKLGILIGLIFGYPNALAAILLSFLTGSVIAVLLIILKRKHFGQTIPFGPFLSLGSILTLLWGEKITSFYLNLTNASNPLLFQLPFFH